MQYAKNNDIFIYCHLYYKMAALYNNRINN